MKEFLFLKELVRCICHLSRVASQIISSTRYSSTMARQTFLTKTDCVVMNDPLPILHCEIPVSRKRCLKNTASFRIGSKGALYLVCCFVILGPTFLNISYMRKKFLNQGFSNGSSALLRATKQFSGATSKGFH